MLATLLKLLGLVIATVGAGLALFGETSKDTRLTHRGKVALAILLTGFAITTVVEVLALRSSQASERWDTLKTLPITSVIYEFRSINPRTAADLVAILNHIRISYTARVPASNDRRRLAVLWAHNPTLLDSQRACTLQLKPSDGQPSVNEVHLYLRDGNLWRHSVHNNWADEANRARIGGLFALTAWQDHGFVPIVSEVHHIARIEYLKVILPAADFLDQFQEASVTLTTTGGIGHRIDLKALTYGDFTDATVQPIIRGKSAFLTGEALLEMWKGHASL